ncbi:hypothetical protein Tco_1502725 [Tanacetum coccineum]
MRRSRSLSTNKGTERLLRSTTMRRSCSLLTIHQCLETVTLKHNGTNIQEKDKKKAKNKQNRARNGKDKVKSKSKVSHMKKIQLEGLKLPNLKLYYKRKRQGLKLQTGRSLL